MNRESRPESSPSNTGSDTASQRRASHAVGYDLLADVGIVRIRLGDAPSSDDSLDMLQKLRDDPGFRAGMNALIDRRTLVEPPDSRYTGAVLEHIAAHLPPSVIRRWAIVTLPGAQFGMARMLSLRGEVRGLAMEAFTDEGEALAWLEARDPGERGTRL